MITSNMVGLLGETAVEARERVNAAYADCRAGVPGAHEAYYAAREAWLAAERAYDAAWDDLHDHD